MSADSHTWSAHDAHLVSTCCSFSLVLLYDAGGAIAGDAILTSSQYKGGGGGGEEEEGRRRRRRGGGGGGGEEEGLNCGKFMAFIIRL